VDGKDKALPGNRISGLYDCGDVSSTVSFEYASSIAYYAREHEISPIIDTGVEADAGERSSSGRRGYGWHHDRRYGTGSVRVTIYTRVQKAQDKIPQRHGSTKRLQREGVCAIAFVVEADLALEQEVESSASGRISQGMSEIEFRRLTVAAQKNALPEKRGCPRGGIGVCAQVRSVENVATVVECTGLEVVDVESGA
jgi:hypothetical protein